MFRCGPDVITRPRLPITIVLCFVISTLFACSDGSDSRTGAGYSALIERTQYGTAHITADNWGSLGFGQGYAFAQDRFCVLADQIVKVRSQRSRYFGSGENNDNLKSDLGYLALGLMERAPLLIDALSADTREMLQGYVAGFNQYLAETGVANVPGACGGAEWLQPIDAVSLMAYYIDISTFNSSQRWVSAIASTQPPGTRGALATSASLATRGPESGSNVFAFGRDKSSTGRGMLLSNTHLTWGGEYSYHESQLTIPGQINVAGVALAGFLGIVNGFNESIAWSHTTSTASQYIIYSLDLVPGSPTRYYYGDEEVDMEARSYRVEVLQQDGSLTEEIYTLYHSQYGPILNPGLGLSWDETTAYTLFDPNLENAGFVDGLLPLGQAESIADLQVSLAQVGTAPFNIIAAQDDGETFYADVAPVPMLSEGAEAAYLQLINSDEPNEAQRLYFFPFGLGFTLLDGSDPTFSVIYDSRATVPGTIPFVEAPQLERSDFVGNSNNSYWLSNPLQPLTGYSIRYGEVETPRSLRTRMGLTQIGESSGWSRVMLEELLFANRSFTEELWRDSLASYCPQFSHVTASNGENVDIRQACRVISEWDGVHDLDSVGAMLFRETTANGDGRGLLNGRSIYSEPFDVSRPVETPAGVTREGLDYLMTQLADAVLRLGQAGIPIDGALGDYQYTIRGTERFPIHGAQTIADGAFNVVNYSGGGNSTLLPRFPIGELVNGRTALTDEGYPVNAGATWIMAMEFTEDGPMADALLVYSQSDDPSSVHFSDQTSLYSKKIWRPLPFTREQIESDPFLVSMRVTD